MVHLTQKELRTTGKVKGERMGGALEVKIISLSAHQSKAHLKKKRRKKQNDSLRSCAAALSNESN